MRTNTLEGTTWMYCKKCKNVALGTNISTSQKNNKNSIIIVDVYC